MAATIAALLGEDYLAEAPKAAKPIGDMIAPTEKRRKRRPLCPCAESHSARARPRSARSPSGMPSWPAGPS